MSAQKQEFFNSLEGIRGYAFLAVFLLHYNSAWTKPLRLSDYPGYLLLNTTWFLVPIFFVLSGFLITRTLVATRERQGFFRTFYFRRAIRVLPLYYVTALVVLGVALLWHWPLTAKHLLYLSYLQNFTHSSPSTSLNTVHLWSLALEEQFYLVWPLVIWASRSDKALLRVCYAIVGGSILLRVGWPLLPGSHDYFFGHAYELTFNRIDAIVLGAALSVYYKREEHWDALVKYSKMFIPLAIGFMAFMTITRGTTFPNTPGRIPLYIPLTNFIGFAFVVLALSPATLVARVCSGARICNFGKLTYGLYIIHYLYEPWFIRQIPVLNQHMPYLIARAVVSAAALALTYVLATFAYKFIEMPAMRLKDRVKYGPAVVRASSENALPWNRWVRIPALVQMRSLLAARREPLL